MQLLYPLNGIGKIPGIYITQLFGKNPQDYPGYKGHMGIDFGCPTGTQVLAAHDGYIGFPPYDAGGYGNHIYLSSPDGSFLTVYGHLKSFVGSSRLAKAGEVIAISNNTGDSTGPHLHFGLQPLPIINNGYGGYIDPLPYLKGFAMLIFFKVKGSQTIWKLIDGTWVGFSDLNAFNQYTSGRATQVIELDQAEFNKLQSSPNVFKT